MNTVKRVSDSSGVQRVRKGLGWILSVALLFVTLPTDLFAAQDAQAPAPASSGPQYAVKTPEQLQQLVAPIALYPDELVAQVLSAATFPEQVVEADRYVQTHPDLKGEALAQAVDQMDWDPSVKALTAFPSVLGNMDKNISWTSTLGDAYYNQQQDVMDAVQVMRQRAQQAGNLKTTPQQAVTTEGSTITIEPAAPEVVYVPAYDPWVVYGPPVVAWPGWYAYPGIWWDGPYVSWGIGFGIGFFWGWGWGWHHWGCDWHHHYVSYHGDRYYSHSRTFYNRNTYYRGGHGGPEAFSRGARPPGSPAAHGNVYNRPGASPKPFEGNKNAARGYGQPRGLSNTRSGAFSHYDHGGESRGYSARGSASMGGGFHGGGGGFHGGGGAPHH